MEFDWSVKIFIIFICLLILALFSAAEVALFSVEKKKIKKPFHSEKWNSFYQNILFENPQRTQITLIIGSTIATVGASILAVSNAVYCATYFKIAIEVPILSQIIILTFIILLLGKTFPKLLAYNYPQYVIKTVVLPIYILNILFTPVSKILEAIKKAHEKHFVETRSSTALRENDIQEFSDYRIDTGTIEEGEHELIHGIVTFKNITAREVMTPRVDIQAIEVGESFEELVGKINESGHSRIPLYQNSLDKIIGIIYAKDLLPFIKNPAISKSLSLKSIAKEVLYVPSSKMIKELLHEFQAKKLHLGIVVDEYGGTAGLITLEDILEEIVGEIRDENEKDEDGIIEVDINQFIAPGKLNIDKLTEYFRIDFSSINDDYDTLGGFILNHAGKIPQQGYSFIENNYKFTVKEVSKKRINRVMIEKENIN